MKKRLVDLVSGLDYGELIKMQRDLFTGGSLIKQLVNNKIKEINERESALCATCGATFTLSSADEYTLIFGPAEFKRRATFCAMDCMEYFFANLKEIAAKKLRPSKQTNQTKQE